MSCNRQQKVYSEYSRIANEIVQLKNCTVIGILEETSETNGIGIGEVLTDGLIKFESSEWDARIIKRAVIKRLLGVEHSTRFSNVNLTPNQGISFA